LTLLLLLFVFTFFTSPAVYLSSSPRSSAMAMVLTARFSIETSTQ